MALSLVSIVVAPEGFMPAAMSGLHEPKSNGTAGCSLPPLDKFNGVLQQLTDVGPLLLAGHCRSDSLLTGHWKVFGFVWLLCCLGCLACLATAPTVGSSWETSCLQVGCGTGGQCWALRAGDSEGIVGREGLSVPGFALLLLGVAQGPPVGSPTACSARLEASCASV